MYSAILTSVISKIENSHHDTNVTLQSVLEELGVTESMYVKALHWIKTKQGQPAIIYKRNPSDCMINNYNPTLMKG
jgi:hypothetical protein